MARRRKLETPSTEHLDALEAEFRRETPGLGAAVAPIAQVAADAAAQQVMDPDARAQQLQDSADAATLRAAQDDGRLIVEIPLDQITTSTLTRDRVDLDAADMDELKLSIASSGLRLPIEVQAISDTSYLLISGYRRLFAFQELARIYPDGYATIKALVRPAKNTADAFAAMVEENEVRSDLTHFERGRIAVLAVQQGAFVNVEDAVDRMFSAASKAKRSKIRSFATLFEDLGDMLLFPKDLREKDGLRIVAALRQGAENAMRDALAHASIDTSDDERAVLLSVAESVLAETPVLNKGGRPKKQAQSPNWVDSTPVELENGFRLQHCHDEQGHFIRVTGRKVDRDMMEAVISHVRYMLDTPD